MLAYLLAVSDDRSLTPTTPNSRPAYRLLEACARGALSDCAWAIDTTPQSPMTPIADTMADGLTKGVERVDTGLFFILEPLAVENSSVCFTLTEIG